MKLVIDANIVKAYYMETVLEIGGGLTSHTVPLFDRLDGIDQLFFDENGQIEHEWQGLVEREWFNAWYPSLFINGSAFEIPVNTEHDLRKRLEGKCGFPKGNKDFWYIKTAMSVAKTHSQAHLISEDMDLHEPSEKKASGNNRTRILLSGNGKVCNLLRKESIFILCVASYLDIFEQH